MVLPSGLIARQLIDCPWRRRTDPRRTSAPSGSGSPNESTGGLLCAGADRAARRHSATTDSSLGMGPSRGSGRGGAGELEGGLDPADRLLGLLAGVRVRGAGQRLERREEVLSFGVELRDDVRRLRAAVLLRPVLE